MISIASNSELDERNLFDERNSRLSDSPKFTFNNLNEEQLNRLLNEDDPYEVKGMKLAKT